MIKAINIFILIIAFNAGASGLGTDTGSVTDFTGGPEETIAVHLTAGTVFTGELLWFKIYCTSPLFPGTEISNLAFIELVSPDNTSVLRQKILIDHGEGTGVFNIPATLPTGLYYILAYTNWMKNSGESSFFTQPVAIINPSQPFNSRAASQPTESSLGKKCRATGALTVRISSGKRKYGTGEQVMIGISATDGSGTEVPASMSVSVTKKEPDLIFSSGDNRPVPVRENHDGGSFLPDHKGILLSGSVVDENGTPAGRMPLVLSAPGRGTMVMTAVTDRSGHFRFLLKAVSGEKDLIITLPGQEYKLSVDDPFTNGFRNMPSDWVLHITPGTLEFLREKYMYLQLMSRFGVKVSQEYNQPQQLTDSTVFYKKPYRTIHPGRYIQLDSIAEYFHELIPEVRFVHRKSGYDITVINPDQQDYLKEPPGLFVDGVPFSDYAAIAAIPVRELDRITVLPDNYYYRDLYFGGIIDIHTKRSDFSAVKLTGDMVRFIYPVANSCRWIFREPEQPGLHGLSRIPDFRYLLSWEPGLVKKSGEKALFTFHTGDLEGIFVVHVTGLSSSGTLFTGEYEFAVERNSENR